MHTQLLPICNGICNGKEILRLHALVSVAQRSKVAPTSDRLDEHTDSKKCAHSLSGRNDEHIVRNVVAATLGAAKEYCRQGGMEVFYRILRACRMESGFREHSP